MRVPTAGRCCYGARGMRPRRSFAVACALSLCALAAPARAQDAAAAKALFDRGVGDMQGERYAQACPAIEESYHLDPRAGTLFTLAECEAKRGRLATAVARYDEYLALYARLSGEQLRKQGDRDKRAHSQKAALGPRVPMLTLSLLPGAPPGTLVKRDGAELSAAALGVASPVDPGEHVATTQAPGGPVTTVPVTLGEGEKKQIILPVKEAAASPKVEPLAPVVAPIVAPGPRAEPGPSGRRTAAYVVGGVGVAGLVLGGVMGGLALADKSVIAQHCDVGGDPTACDATGFSAASSANAKALASSVGFGVGAAGVVTAVILLLTDPRRASAAAQGARDGVPWVGLGREPGTVAVGGVW